MGPASARALTPQQAGNLSLYSGKTRLLLWLPSSLPPPAPPLSFFSPFFPSIMYDPFSFHLSFSHFIVHPFLHPHGPPTVSHVLSTDT